ncbi:hypothetical protein GQ457_11G023720 [Hibiscus cannabinus]
MTKSNPQRPLYVFYPEIKITQRKLRRGIRNLIANNGQNQNPMAGHNPPAPAYAVINLPIPQNQLDIPYCEAEKFELKPVMFNMFNTLGQFGGSPNENARQHLKSFLEICNSFKLPRVSNDVLKMKLFPYSLRDKEKTWLDNLTPGSLQSWTKMCRIFLAIFSHNNMTDKLRNEITSFRQEDDELMYEAWERYKDLYRRCSMHGLPEWTQVSILYN